MAKFKVLPDNVIANLQTKIGLSTSLQTMESLGATSQLTLNESIDIWKLPANAVNEVTNNLSQLAQFSEEWHLQIKDDVHPVAYARTSSLDSTSIDWPIDGIFQSDLALKIDQTMDWIETNFPSEDILVRLLIASAYQIHAFWLIDQSTSDKQTIVIIEAPDEYNLQKPPATYNTKQFLDSLRLNGHIEGIF